MTTSVYRALLAGLVAMSASPLVAAHQPKEPSAVSAWIAAPAAGATFATAYVEVDNPTMYEIFVVSATADGVAGKVELRGAAAAGAEPPVVNEFPVPSYGSTSAAVGAPHLRLLNLAKPLKPGDTVPLTLTTEAGIVLKVSAGVRAQ